MVTYHGQQETITVGFLAPNCSADAQREAEFMIVRTIDVIRECPVAGDILEPLPGVKFVVRHRRFEKRGNDLHLWIHAEAIQ